ncbi:hypothetical protein FOA52_013048 [Chlamydomonas sp. UWO 241]|nr:hypothetical protein FOA52_013048 [Chlamydomonas sp. UWO 241]
MSWLLAITTVAAFVQQWGPLSPALAHAAAALHPQPLLAFALAVPPTPAVDATSLHVASLLAGDWARVATSAFVHSGALCAALSCAVLLQTGGVLERAFGPLVLLMHVGAAAGGVAAGQLLMQPTPESIAGPAVACGLAASLLVHQLREGIRPLVVTRTSWAALTLLPALSAVQPMLGPWGVAGGCVGGALAALTWSPLLSVLRVCVFLPLFLAAAVLEAVGDVAGAAPRVVAQALSAVLVFAWRVLAAVAGAFRAFR